MTLLGLLIAGWHWLDPLSFDIPLVLRRPIATTNTVIIAMDEETYATMGLLQDQHLIVDRAHHVNLLDRLQSAGARAVVFDLLFSTFSADPRVDARLGEAMRRFGPVAVAAKLRHTDYTKAGGTTPVYPISVIATNARVGFAEATRDRDPVLRQHYADAQFTNLAWVALSMLEPPPGPPGEPRWIHYYGPPTTLPTLLYSHVIHPSGQTLSDPDLAALVRGKVVFVGDGRQRDTSDRHSTPHTWWRNTQMAGVEIQATTFLNLLRRDWLRRLSGPWEWLILIAAGVGAGGGLARWRPWPALVVAVGLALAISLASVALVWLGGWWFSWLIIVAVQLPAAFAWSLICAAARAAKANRATPPETSSSAAAATASAAASAQSDAAGLASTTPSAGEDPPPIPDHTLLRRVGRGSYGQVWLAQNVLGALHAVKVVHRSRFPGREPFERELRGVQKFMPISRGHPGWVPLLHVGRHSTPECFFYVMEAADDVRHGARIEPEGYAPRALDGEIVRRGPLPLDECLSVGIDLALALVYLHRHQLIHRDIKPSNVVYLRNAPRFADIGLVTDIGGPGQDTSFVGTQDYLCPEGPGTPGADVYALGKVLYAAMTGLPASMFPELPTRQMESAHESGLLEFYEVLATACEPDARRRYPSAQEFHDALMALRDAQTRG